MPAWFLQMVQRTGKAAKLPFQIHPHMLRHSTGYKLANQGEDTRFVGALSGASQFTIDGQIYGASPGSVRWVLEGLAFCESPWRHGG